MARKRDQEDVFKPLNDSPADEVDEPRRSGRGWEVKLGLAVLLLLIGGTGYVAYSQFMSGDESDELAAGQLDLSDSAGSGVVPAVVEPELPIDAEPLELTQFNAAPDSKSPTSGGAWTASEPGPDAEPVGRTFESRPNQSYAANYGGQDYSTPRQSYESPAAPMPNPSDFGAGTAVAPSIDAPSSPTSQYAYPDQFAATRPEPATQEAPEASAPTGDVTYENNGMSQVQGRDLGAPSYDSAMAGAVPPEQPPRVSLYGASAPQQQSYAEASAAPSYEEPSASLYEPPQQPSYSGTATTPPNADSPAPTYEPPQPPSYKATAEAPAPSQWSSTSAPSADLHRTYGGALTSKTHADFAGQSGSELDDRKMADTIWQQPTVTPVDGKYTAQPNDNFFTIAKKVYGSGAYFEALARHNKDKYPKANQIRIGDVIQTPTVATLESRYPELCPAPEHRDAAKQRSTATANRSLAGRRVYVVQEGDNLFDIARYELGARARVAELIELNRDVLGDQINYLTPGMRLVLPESGDQGPRVTQGPTGTLR